MNGLNQILRMPLTPTPALPLSGGGRGWLSRPLPSRLRRSEASASPRRVQRGGTYWYPHLRGEGIGHTLECHVCFNAFTKCNSAYYKSVHCKKGDARSVRANRASMRKAHMASGGVFRCRGGPVQTSERGGNAGLNSRGTAHVNNIGSSMQGFNTTRNPKQMILFVRHISFKQDKFVFATRG